MNAASWRLAAELTAGLSGSRIAQRYGGGEQDDELVLTRGGFEVISVNRNGSLHLLREGPHSIPLWPDACRPGAAEQLARRALVQLGAHGRHRSGAQLGYQVIAIALTARVMDSTAWDAVHLADDDRPRTVRAPRRCELDAPLDEVWALTADDEVVAWLWEGWAVWPGGERLDLTRARGAGATLAALAGQVTSRRPRGYAAALDGSLPKVEFADAPSAWLDFAGRYDAYRHLAAEPAALQQTLATARAAYVSEGAVPAWAGPDLLRGWLFLLYREDHFDGGLLLASERGAREFADVINAWRAATAN